ncbi:MAG: GDSL-type esterase/lipase family protein [Deltaproteobacteria bacterium]|nr:GDSL-type esterase/lipase family protein [Deltaproteobacteria bacterium]
MAGKCPRQTRGPGLNLPRLRSGLVVVDKSLKILFLLLLAAFMVCGTLWAESETPPEAASGAEESTGPADVSTVSGHSRAEFKRTKAQRTIVMLGDSLTQGGVWDSLDPEAKVLNHGISGDGVAQILKRLDQTIAAAPDIVFLQVGINDFSHIRNISEIVEGHKDIWARLKVALPEVRIIICSLIPVNEVKLRVKIDMNSFIRQTNELLAASAAEANLEFIDLYAPLAGPDQALPVPFTFDGLHLTNQGQQLWLAELRKFLKDHKSRAFSADR